MTSLTHQHHPVRSIPKANNKRAMPRQAARYVFSNGNGRPKYLAWVPVTVPRKMDLTPEVIARRESNAYCFYSGWDDTLHSNGLLIKIQDADLPEGIAWLVDFVEASKMLGCTTSSLCKNIEVMRHMTSADKKFHYVLARCETKRSRSLTISQNRQLLGAQESRRDMHRDATCACARAAHGDLEGIHGDTQGEQQNVGEEAAGQVRHDAEDSAGDLYRGAAGRVPEQDARGFGGTGGDPRGPLPPPPRAGIATSPPSRGRNVVVKQCCSSDHQGRGLPFTCDFFFALAFHAQREQRHNVKREKCHGQRHGGTEAVAVMHQSAGARRFGPRVAPTVVSLHRQHAKVNGRSETQYRRDHADVFPRPEERRFHVRRPL